MKVSSDLSTDRQLILAGVLMEKFGSDWSPKGERRKKDVGSCSIAVEEVQL